MKCRQCGESFRRDGRGGVDVGICRWCRQIRQAQAEVHEREEACSLGGYQPIGPQGGRLWTRNGDPGK